MAAQYIEITTRKYNNVPSAQTLSINPTKTVWAYTKKVPGTASRTTTTATITMDNHGFLVGDSVVITGDAPFAGTYTVVAVPNVNTFTYTVANSGATSGAINALVTVVYQNYDIGPGATPPAMQITITLTALLALFPSGTAAKLTQIGDTETETLSSAANGIPVVWPLSSMISFKGVNGTAIAATNTVRSLTTVTITAANHGLIVGQWVVVSGATTSALNGTYQVTTVADANTFTYTTTTSGTVASGTATVTPQTSLITVDQLGATATKYAVYEAYAAIQTAYTSA